MKAILLPVLFAVGTALCWGLYGPTLTNARSPSGEWSPFKPYVFIGVAYLVWAVAGGLVGMNLRQDSYSYSGGQTPAMVWGFLAGTLGALGALCLTSSMLSGGRPAYVMPIVFGGAVTINAIVAYFQLRGQAQTSPVLWGGMLLTVIGVVTVAAKTPHRHPPARAVEQPQTTVTQPADASPAEVPPAEVPTES